MANTIKSRLEGYHPTIDLENWRSKESLDNILPEFLDNISSGHVSVSPDEFKEILFRNSNERNIVFSDDVVLSKLVEHEKRCDTDQLKEALKCLGHFPKHEVEFLKNILSMKDSAANNAVKFKYLEEGLFTLNKEYLCCYRVNNAGQKALNEAILELVGTKTFGHDIREAVNKILLPPVPSGGQQILDNLDPFTAGNYTLGGHDFKNTFEMCYKRKSFANRLCTLKGIFQKAVKGRDKVFLIKFICSHASKDLKDILGSFTDVDLKMRMEEAGETDFEAVYGDMKKRGKWPLLLSGTTQHDLFEALDIKGSNLRNLITMVAGY